LLAVLSLLIFGSATLQDFAFAMLIGIASGTYSSIFIASPVLTAWKEREPQYIRRRQRIAEVEGSVPAFADDVQVALLAADDETEAAAASRKAEVPAAEPEPEAGAVATAERPGDDGDSDGAPENRKGNGVAPTSAAPADSDANPESAERRKRNDERRARRAQRRKGRRR
jgi:SecD/SecF fusion protein